MDTDSLIKKDYLKIGKASDLKNRKEKIIFRIFEIFPGILSWGVLFLVILLSWKKPVWIAIFIIFYSIFYLFRTVYFSFHLQAGFKKMKKHEKIDWLKKISAFPDWQNLYHLIILTMYKEPLEIVRESFLYLEKTDYPKDRMIVVLACEKRAGEKIKELVKEIKKEFSHKFFRFLVTFHPANLAGEVAGKGSNETWAARKVKKIIIDPLKIPYQNIIFTTLDVDTCVYPKYFSCLVWHYLTSKNPTRTSFQPIPLYINNIWQAPVVSKIFAFSSTFWHTINQERPEKLVTFSSHSMSFKALVEVDFKQTNVVSDDSRIFWQCFLRYDGDYGVRPLYYPISMDANVAKNFWQTVVNIYKQQKRWAYGVGDIAYFLFGFIKNKKIPISKKISLGFELIEGHFSWATASVMIFLLGWLPVIFGGPGFSQTLIAFNLPQIISRILTLAMVGLVGSAYFSLILLPPKPPEYGRFKYVFFILGWLLVPIIMIFFTSLPALDAQIRWALGKYMGFWPTEKIRK
jgi:hypothetical protein